MMRTFGYAIINGINTVNMEDNKQNQWAKKKKKKKKKGNFFAMLKQETSI